MLIDTHCHLDDERFEEDLDEVIKRAFKNGVKAFVIPGADPDDLEKAKNISERYDEIFFAAGVHPYEIEKFDERALKEYLKHPKCIAVGECGLDYYRLPKDETEKKEEKERQKEIFSKHIKLAKEVQKPLIVHIREASFDSKEILINNGAKDVGGVLHCFNASEILLELSNYGFYFGIGGVITFKNAKKLVNILPKIPKDKIVLETDAPYLTPHPYRGKRNEPAYTLYVAQKIAEILGMDLADVCSITIKNAKRVFKELEKIV
ncbi:TatD family hydrolase [Nitrosophilus labii]|uniref:TatD family hydrolase n=1 Tax=Nitrosophilus labii TaxID=2706014 RepID=UPI001656FE28|nr:TatD family hydrolase [Nitrosophilus labii]